MLRPQPIAVTALQEHKLRITFETGETKIFDVTPYIMGSWFGELAKEEVFRTAHIAQGTVMWAGGQDLAPHELYDNSVPA